MARAGWRVASWGVLLLLPLLLTACARPEQATPTPDGEGADQDETPDVQVTPTPFTLPTLLPTATALVAPAANVTSTPAPTASPQSTVDFQQPVVELRYTIPSLQLDRRLEGDVSGQVTVVDETRGVAAIRQNQGGVLLELQGVLPELDLEPLPADCDTCVAFSYELFLEGIEGQGWLQDPVLLASVENYTAALLGPHFPPGAVLGLRRSATAYDVAHSLALDENGLLYRWLATSGEVEAPTPIDGVAPDLPQLVAALEQESFQQQYIVSCVSAPLEALFIRGAEVDSEGEMDNLIHLSCPAYSLPRSLLPLYSRLDFLLEEVLEGSGIPRPPSEVALGAVIDYRNENEAHVSVLFDGTTTVEDEAGETFTTTLDMTEVVSMTENLLGSSVLQPELSNFIDGELPNNLLVRGEQGMMEAAWPEGDPPQEMVDEIEILERLFASDEETDEINEVEE